MPRPCDGVVAWAGRIPNGLVEVHRDLTTIVSHREHRSVRGEPALHFHVLWGQLLIPFRVEGVDHGEGCGGGCSVATCVRGGEAHGDGCVAAARDCVSRKVVGPRDVSAVVGDHRATT